ncbi:hypothetical protein QL285_038709 [Trifolium repens]|nr:hypothetical protein QL285_038709 [Trifolium repens]
MGEEQIQTQQEPMTPPPITMAHKHKQQQLFQEAIGRTDHHSVVVEPTDLFSMLHLNSNTDSSNRRRHPPCTTATPNNSVKRRSITAVLFLRRTKRQEALLRSRRHNQSWLLRHFSSYQPRHPSRQQRVLRRCVSDPYKPPARGSRLPPLPPRFTRYLSYLTPSPAKGSSRSLSSEEIAPDSMRLRRMRDRLREMKQWWDEVMKEEEEGEEAEEEEYIPVAAENGKIPSQDELGGDYEEAVSVEWAEKCVSLTFRCPCGKGYEVLISANNCYYKLL